MDSSSSANLTKINYDVFLSFRGTDTRQNFTSHLYAALRRKHIHTFIDENDLDRGEEITPTLLKTIQESKISIIIFSEKYASSPWCLDELVKIMECTKTTGQKAVPVFFNVDPSDVSDLTGNFGEGFKKQMEIFSNSIDRVRKWCSALEEAANLSGWDSSNHNQLQTQINCNHAELIEKVADHIMQKLYPTSFTYSNELVGIDSHIEQILSYVSIGSKDVRFVGLWGMGGVGKTTITEILYSQISCQFERCYFFRSVREELEKNGPTNLRKKFLSQLLGIEISDIEMLHVVPTYIKDSLSRLKVLVVLDDVSDPNQLEALGVGEGWFGPETRIILTSRDKEVLNLVGEIYIYKVDGLNPSDGLELLSMKAFKQRYPPEDYDELSRRVLCYARGLPLALKVLGSHLFKRTPKEWEVELNKLNQYPDSTIQNILQISFDELDDVLKDIFLDIACFFRLCGKDAIIDILDGSDFPTSWGINRLSEKCLITIDSENIVEMHDLVQDMGQEIARRKGNRFFNRKDIIRLLTTNMRNETVEGIVFDMAEVEKIHLSFEALSWMPKLRLLRIYGHQFFTENFDLDCPPCLSSNLSYLHWDHYPFKSLPLNFLMQNLVVLIISGSKAIQLWEGNQCLQNLKFLGLSNSVHLMRLPDLSSATKLEGLDLGYCKSLEVLPTCIGKLMNLKSLIVAHCENLRSIPSLINLNSLEALNLRGCLNLKYLPEIPCGIELVEFDTSGVEEWPASLDFLNNGIVLDASGCRNLQKFPENITGNFERIILDRTAIQELPSSIVKCFSSTLGYLSMKECEVLEILPNNICELKCLQLLELDGCLKLSKLPPLNGLSSLTTLSLAGSGIVEIPADIVSLTSLNRLVLNNCRRLRSLPLPPWQLSTLEANDCTMLRAASIASIALVYFSNPGICLPFFGYFEFHFCNCIRLDFNALRKIMADARWRIEETTHLPFEQTCFRIGLPGSEIPEWFNYQNPGSSLVVQVPHFSYPAYLSCALCVVVESGGCPVNALPFCFQCGCICKRDSDTEFRVGNAVMNVNSGVLESDHVLLWHWNNSWVRIEEEFSGKEASFRFELQIPWMVSDYVRLKIKSCGVHWIVHHQRPDIEELELSEGIPGK